MVPRKETAEEQLLRMIEGGMGAGDPSPIPVPQPSDPPGPAVPPSRSLRDLWEQLWNRIALTVLPSKNRLESGDPLLMNLRIVRRVLWMLLAGLGVYMVVALARVSPDYKLSGAVHSAGDPSSHLAVPENPLKPLAEYLGAILRDPFTGSMPGVSTEGVKTTKRRLEDITAGLTLVGIDRGPNPAALVESGEQHKTTVVNVGDEINGMRVKKINQDGVVLEYEGEEYVLR